MKKIITALALVAFFVSGVFAQTGTPSRKKIILHDGSVFFGAFYTPLLSENMIGFTFSVKGFLTERYAAGFSMSYAYRKTTADFDYTVGSPVLDYFEWGIEQQYDLLRGKRFRVGASLNNGLGIAQLSDNDSVVQYMTRNGLRDRAKPVVTNYFYQVQPGFDFSMRCTSIEKSPVLNITGKVKYNMMIGPTRFGSTSDFCKPYFAIGFSLTGLSEPRR